MNSALATRNLQLLKSVPWNLNDKSHAKNSKWFLELNSTDTNCWMRRHAAAGSIHRSRARRNPGCVLSRALQEAGATKGRRWHCGCMCHQLLADLGLVTLEKPSGIFREQMGVGSNWQTLSSSPLNSSKDEKEIHVLTVLGSYSELTGTQQHGLPSRGCHVPEPSLSWTSSPIFYWLQQSRSWRIGHLGRIE